MSGWFGGGGGGGDSITVYSSWSDLPPSAGAGAYAYLSDTGLALRYDQTASEWRPAPLYLASLSWAFRATTRDLSLADGASVTSWGGATQGSASAQPTFDADGAPGGGEGSIVFDGGDHLALSSVAGIGGAAVLVTATILKLSATNNEAIFSLHEGGTAVQQTFVGTSIQHSIRRDGSDGSSVPNTGIQPPTGEWLLIVTQLDAENDTIETLYQELDEAYLPVPRSPQEGLVSASLAAGAGTFTNDALGLTIGVNGTITAATRLNGEIAALAIGVAGETLTGLQLAALGSQLYLEAVG